MHTKDKKAWTYGYFEARIKMPTNKSTWPAFWMSPQEAKYGGWPKSGEIDIVETKGSNLNYAASDAHWGISSVDKSHDQRISNLTSLEAAKNVTALSLQNNAISDLRPLAGLASLTSLNLNDQLIASSINTDSFASPLRDPAGNAVDINNSTEIANDTANPRNIKLLSPIRDGNTHLIVANWSRNVTIGTASAVFSGKLNITATLQAAPAPQPQPNPSTPSNTQKTGKTQSSNNSLASTGFNILLGVVTALLISIAGMFILR